MSIMGIINHNAVIATTQINNKYVELQNWVINDCTPEQQKMFLFGPMTINGTQTVTLVPDGSKEGWSESEIGDALRQSLIDRLEQDKYDDGSSPWKWIEVGYGEYGQKVLRGNNRNLYSHVDYHHE